MSDAHDIREPLPPALDVPLVVNADGDVVTDPAAGIFHDDPDTSHDFDNLSEVDQESIIAAAEAVLAPLDVTDKNPSEENIDSDRLERFRDIARATGFFPSEEVLESFPKRHQDLVDGSYDDKTDEELEATIRALALAERRDHTGDAWQS